MSEKLYIVLDIGKTISKISIWDGHGNQIDFAERKNIPQEYQKYTALDTKNTEEFVFATLKQFAKLGRIEAIIPITHGAAAALFNDNGLICPPIDYEFPIDAEIASKYGLLRDDFEINFSPKMENGLNLGAQLFYLKETLGHEFSDATILPYAQYWAYLLSGRAVTELTSIGSHTDLWDFRLNDYSNMAKAMGFAQKFAPFANNSKPIGTIRSDLAEKLNINRDAKIYAGLHDSNAAFFQIRSMNELQDKEFCVVSTGTWFVYMHPLSHENHSFLKSLGQKNAVLANIDTFGSIMPTALFMGGRLVENVIGKGAKRIDLDENQKALFDAIKTMPPRPHIIEMFERFIGGNSNALDEILGAELSTSVAFYLAHVSKERIAAVFDGENVVLDGRFANSKIFCHFLKEIMQEKKFFRTEIGANVSFGALKLIVPDLNQKGTLIPI